MATWDPSCFDADITGGQDVATIRCLEPLFANVVTSIMALAGIGLFIMLIMSGYSYLFSGGDPKKLEQAKNTLTFAIMGLVVMVTSFLILRTIQAFTGVNLTTFSIKIF
jgi:hypothetical protein